MTWTQRREQKKKLIHCKDAERDQISAFAALVIVLSHFLDFECAPIFSLMIFFAYCNGEICRRISSNPETAELLQIKWDFADLANLGLIYNAFSHCNWRAYPQDCRNEIWFRGWIGWLTKCKTKRRTDQLHDASIDWLVHGFIASMVDWLIDWGNSDHVDHWSIDQSELWLIDRAFEHTQSNHASEDHGSMASHKRKRSCMYKFVKEYLVLYVTLQSVSEMQVGLLATSLHCKDSGHTCQKFTPKKKCNPSNWPWPRTVSVAYSLWDCACPLDMLLPKVKCQSVYCVLTYTLFSVCKTQLPAAE